MLDNTSRHHRRLLAVAVAMGELEMVTDPQTGEHYYMRTDKPSPVFGDTPHVKLPLGPGCEAETGHHHETAREQSRRRRRGLLGFRFTIRVVAMLLAGFPLAGIAWSSEMAERASQSTAVQVVSPSPDAETVR